MLVPMLSFALVLMVGGGLLSLVAVADPRHKWWLPYLGFTTFFAGLLAFCLSIGVGFFIDRVLGWSASAPLSALLFFGSYFLGGLGGAVLGFLLASRHRRRLDEAWPSGEDPGAENG